MDKNEQLEDDLPVHRKLLLSRGEAALLCGMHYKTFEKYVATGELPRAFLGKARGAKWSRAQLDRFFISQH